MSMKRTRKFLARVEGLEFREVLSTVAPVPVAAQVGTVTGSGTLTHDASTTPGGDAHERVDTLAGGSTQLGNFTGAITSTLTPGSHAGHVSATAVLTASNGSTLDLAFAHSGDHVDHHKGIHIDLGKSKDAAETLSFTITGGTGAYAGDAGTGMLVVNRGGKAGSEAFTLDARIS